jgi:hypothetical protein
MNTYDRPVEIGTGIDIGARNYLERVGRAMPVADMSEPMRALNFFGAMDNFTRMFDIHNDDKVVFLLDRLIDPRVVNAIDGFSRSRGPKPLAITYPSCQQETLPEDVKVILDKATFVVSTWFCSVADPHAVKLRREQGQRWVKITYFRDLDLLDTAHARFPIELIGEIVRATNARYRRGAQHGPLVITDRRGSSFRYDVTPAWADQLMNTNRWKGELFADKPGAYVHYLSTHGPNVYERTALKVDHASAVMPINGTIYPQWAVGFPRPFAERIGVRWQDDVIVEVTGESSDAADLREMLVGGKLIELTGRAALRHRSREAEPLHPAHDAELGRAPDPHGSGDVRQHGRGRRRAARDGRLPRSVARSGRRRTGGDVRRPGRLAGGMAGVVA